VIIGMTIAAGIIGMSQVTGRGAVRTVAFPTRCNRKAAIVDARMACRAIYSFPSGMRLRQNIDFRFGSCGGYGINIVVIVVGSIVIRRGIIVGFVAIAIVVIVTAA